MGRANIFPKGFPLRKNFPQAQALLQKYHALSDFQLLHQLLLDLRTIWNESRTLNALPSTLEELQLALEHDLTYIYQKNATRDVKWLQEHGTCIDHIVHRPSTIQGAGEGAFAKRTLPKGTIITGSPLLTIPSEGFLDMYDDETTEDDDDEEEDNQYRAPFTKQILYNYCLGHPESTLLFFPYAAVGVQYINHNSSLANVKIQWANHGKLRHNARLLKLSSEEIYSSVWNPSLGIEYVALTDIAEGEELFLDYGEEWNTAWTRHVETWMPPNEDTIAADWNEKNEYIPIKEEESDHSNQPNIELRCHAFLLQDDWESKNYPWKRYGNFRQKHLDVYGVPCVVLERNISNDTYTVEVSRDYLTYIPIPEGMDEGTLIRRGVPRDALFFLDVPYESDLYLESAFRHVITMPDHMIPLTWRNKPKADTGRSARHEEL